MDHFYVRIVDFGGYSLLVEVSRIVELWLKINEETIGDWKCLPAN